MPTPHISAQPGDIAEAVLLPGDPLRARFVAESFIDDAREVTSVRNILGYTGSYQGMPVSVMGTGMGIPSASIYGTELISEYGVQRLVRVGSCGAVSDDVAIRDVIIATGACTDSGVNRTRYNNWDFAAIADFGLATAAVTAAKAKGLDVKVGNVHSADLFYNPIMDDVLVALRRMGVLAVEMEAAGLFGLAAENGARALAILTVSDHIKTGEATTSDERERTFNEMIEVALDCLVRDLA